MRVFVGFPRAMFASKSLSIAARSSSVTRRRKARDAWYWRVVLAAADGVRFFAGLGDEHPFKARRMVVERGDDVPRGGEIFLHQDGRDEERVADIVEALAARRRRRGNRGRAEIHAEEVADGVVVFVAVEPADGGAAGVAREVAGFEFPEDGLDFADDGFALGGRGEFIDIVLGRHVAGLDLFGDVFEEPVVLERGFRGGKMVHFDAALLFFFAVAFVTVFPKKRGGIPGEIVRGGDGARGKEERENGMETGHGYGLRQDE